MSVVPFDQREGVIWMDGSFVDWKDAKIHVLSHGLHYASSVFEGERAYDGEIFKSQAHTDRLLNSAKLLDMKVPFSGADIEAAKRETLEKCGLETAYLRPVIWRGSNQMGVTADPDDVRVAIAAWPWGDYFKDREKGIRVTLSDWRRPDPKTIPVKAKAAGLYMICTLSKHAAEREGFSDAMMLDWRGLIAECTGSHIFFLKDGELHTPKGDCILDGITRATAIALAERRGVKVNRRDIRPEELSDFQGCFVTGTAVEITPVREMAGVEFEVGQLIRDLAQDYSDLTHGRLKL